MKGRDRFKCIACGLVHEGKMDASGVVRPYLRAGWNGGPVRPALCLSPSCVETRQAVRTPHNPS